MKQRLYFLILLLFFSIGAAWAVVVPNLNVASVQVLNTAKSTRQQVLPKALGQALVKMSGNSSIMTLPVVQNALDNADGLIKSYSYLRQIQENGKAQLMLQVTFDRKALKKLLRQAGQADWSQDRPLTLLWLQIQSNNNTQMLSNTNDATLSASILKIAKDRGVPVVLPAMDLQDQNFVKADSDNINASSLQQVAARYGATAIFAGIVQQDGNQWRGQWLLLMNDTPFHWRNQAGLLSTLGQQAINEMVNLMANQLAVVNDKDLQTNVTLNVDNVVGLEDYAKVLLTLRHISQVTGVSVIDMNGSDLILQVKTIGGVQALMNALSSQSYFVALETTDNENTKADLFYRWVGKKNYNG